MGLATLLPLLSTGSVLADPLDVRGFGVFMGYSWGKADGFEWGFESIATHHFKKVPACSSEARAGFGPVLRVAMVGGSRLAVTAAVHGGGESTRSVLSFDGELGGTLAFGERGLQAGIHTGALFETLVFNAYARQAWLMSSYSMGGGVRYLPTFGDLGSCAVGRPFRGADGQARLAALRQPRPTAPRSPDARRWATRAAEECASVPAFLQLAHELLGLDAPLELVARALDAAEEELGHTRIASHLASRFADAALRVSPPTFTPRAALPRRQGLQRLARESWLDGCLNEGLSAELARAESLASADDEEAAACARIAREEAGHAELAFDILRWLRREAPDLAWASLTARRPALERPTTSLPHSIASELAHENEARWRAHFDQLRAVA